jgi:hypothetical protein
LPQSAEWAAEERRIFFRNSKIVLLIAAWTLLVYKDIYKARFFLDDYLHLHLIRRIDNVLIPFAKDIMLGAFYRPGIFVFWKLNYLLAGLNPAAYYAVNVATLILSALVLMQVMQHLTGNKGVSGFATLIYSVSPITAIGVLWLSNRFDLIGSFFFLLSLLLFLRYLRFRRTRDISWSLALGFYSYFCKEITITLPAILLMSGMFMFYHRGELTRSVARRITVLTLPFFVMAGAFMVWRYAILGSMGGYSGEERVDLSLGYVALLVHSFGDIVWLFASPLIVIAVALPFFALLAKRHLIKGNLIALYGLLFTLLTAAPLAMVIKVEKVMTYETPRFFFLPGIGLAIFLAAAYDPRSGRARRALAAVFLTVMALVSSLNSFLVTYHTREKTQRAEKKMNDIAGFLDESLPKDGARSVVFACERGLDTALDSSLKVFRPDLLDRAFVLNCGSQTQVIASESLYKERGPDLTFPETFTKNPAQYEDLYYGVVISTPRGILDSMAQKSGVFAVYKDKAGRLAWVTKDSLEEQMKAMGASLE